MKEKKMSGKELRKIHLPKEKNELSFFMHHVIKPISYPLFRLLIKTSLSGNDVSLLMIIVGVLGPVFIAIGSKTYAIIGCLILQFAAMLDAVDGSVARYRGHKSDMERFKGKYLDTIFHDIGIPLLFFCLGVNLYNNTESIEYIYLGFVVSFFVINTNVVRILKYFLIVTEILPEKKYDIMNKELYYFKDVKAGGNKLMGFFIEILRNFSAFSQMYTLVLIAVIFEFTEYLLYFYFVFYLVIFTLKVWIELRDGFTKLLVKKR